MIERISAIERMDRGKRCRLSGRSHYNHQTWRGAKHRTPYFRRRSGAATRAIAGYALFRTSAEEHADAIIRRTRQEHLRHKKENRLDQKRNPTIPLY